MLFGILAVFGDAIAPYEARERAGRPFLTPSGDHLLGTDDVGHDILSELIGGARVSLLIGVAAAAIAVVGGGLLGAVSGYRRGAIDAVVMRAVDFALVVPAIPLLIVLASYLERGMRSQILVVANLLWAEPARIVRSQVLSLRERTHMVAARTYGARAPYLIRRHVLPAVTPLLIAQFVRVVSIAILFEVALSFVGLGDPVRPELGQHDPVRDRQGCLPHRRLEVVDRPAGPVRRPRGLQLRLRRPRPRGTGGSPPGSGRRRLTRSHRRSFRPPSSRLVTVRAHHATQP